MDRQRSLFREDHARLRQELLELANVKGELFFDAHLGTDLRLFFSIFHRDHVPISYGLLVGCWSQVGFAIYLSMFARDDLVTFAVILRKVGKRNAKLPAPIPISREPKDIINEAPLLDDPSKIGPYYEVIPRYASGEPPDRIIVSECRTCRRVKTKVVVQTERRKLRMAEDTWRGQSIFYLGGTLHIVVADSVKNALQSARHSNLQLTEVLCS